MQVKIPTFMHKLPSNMTSNKYKIRLSEESVN